MMNWNPMGLQMDAILKQAVESHEVLVAVKEQLQLQTRALTVIAELLTRLAEGGE